MSICTFEDVYFRNRNKILLGKSDIYIFIYLRIIFFIKVFQMNRNVVISYILTNEKVELLHFFSRAFDSVSIPTLLSKLGKFQIPPELHYILYSFFTNRKIIMNSGSKSKCYDLKCGVPQGSIVSPFFFALYINDIAVQPSQMILYLVLMT